MFFKQSFYPFNVVFKLPTMLKFIFNKIIYDMFYAILIQMLLIDVSRCKARWDPLWVKALYKQINYYYYYYIPRHKHFKRENLTEWFFSHGVINLDIV